MTLKTPSKFQAKSQVSRSLWGMQMLDLWLPYITTTATNCHKVPVNSVLKSNLMYLLPKTVKCGVMEILQFRPAPTLPYYPQLFGMSGKK